MNSWSGSRQALPVRTLITKHLYTILYALEVDGTALQSTLFLQLEFYVEHNTMSGFKVIVVGGVSTGIFLYVNGV